MKKWIVAAVVVVIIIAAAVWYKAGSAPAVAETPETAATPAPTATPEPTPTATPVSDEGLQYKFDLYVETYKYDNNVTDDDLRNNQDTRYAMFNWIWQSGYTYADAETEQADGCTNEFVQQYIDWYYAFSNGTLDTGDTSDTTTDNGSSTGSSGWYEDTDGDMVISGDAYESMKEQIEAQGGELLETQEDADRRNAEIREDSEKLHEDLQDTEYMDQKMEEMIQEFYNDMDIILRGIDMNTKIISASQSSMSKILEK